jgi:putative nucleotidyltransferase with HDIG domain
VSTTQRTRLAEDLVRRLAAAMRGAQLYAPGHPLVTRSIGALADILKLVHATTPSIAIGIVGDDLVVGDYPIPRAAENMGELMRRLQQAGIERIVVDRGVEPDELSRLVQTVARSESLAPGKTRGDAVSEALAKLPHIRVGRLQVAQRVEAVMGDMSTMRRLYDDAAQIAGRLWESAQVEGIPDADAATGMVDNLAQAVAQNRTALLALTALKNYDNYTFTHMVNVSILTMGQARGLGIDGPLLREFGLSALMHDIGKVRTPTEVLNKPDKLTDAEFEIMRRHTVDGAEILRKTPEMPGLAPVVAFEHHLRIDGTGYPFGVKREGLNLGTMLCGIADVYDAMRSQRRYQQAFPTDRILAVLQRNDGTQFDQHLVRRFAQLVGIYPAGNLVRLDNNAIAVVVKTHAPDPHRPRVRVIMTPEGTRLEHPYDLDLWEAREGQPQAIQAPIDPAVYQIDPLSYL